MLCSQFIFPPTLPGGFPDGTMIKTPPANAGDAGDIGLIPGSGRSPGEGNGNPLQYSCLENPMDRGTWWQRSAWGCKESDTTEQLGMQLFSLPRAWVQSLVREPRSHNYWACTASTREPKCYNIQTPTHSGPCRPQLEKSSHATVKKPTCHN